MITLLNLHTFIRLKQEEQFFERERKRERNTVFIEAAGVRPKEQLNLLIKNKFFNTKKFFNSTND